MRRVSAVLTIFCVLLMLTTEPAVALSLRGTQSLLIEYDGRNVTAMGTIVLDIALTPTWSMTYIHDRIWMPGERSVVHDVSVTWVMHRDRTATIGWRLKIPEEGDTTHAVYLMWAWRWGE